MFSLHIETAIDISASPAHIWKILTDLTSYEQWNPMLGDVKTLLALDSGVSFQVLREGSTPLKLKAKVCELKQEKSLAWRGGSFLFISGEHYFRIEQLDEQRCRFHHGEYFKGLFLPLFRPMLKGGEALYRSMNLALKQRAEAPSEET